MKNVVKILFAVLFAVLFAACGATNKVANGTKQQYITTSVNTDTNTQTQASDAVNVRTTETDFSSAVIEFTKIEYTDGTEELTTVADIQRDTAKQRDREPSEPPNVNTNNRNIKSVTSGRVILNNDKKKQIDTSVEHKEQTQVEATTQIDAAEDTTLSVQTEESKGRGFFHNLGIIFGSIIAIFLLIVIIRIFNKFRCRKSD